jgi:hypothetical protein
MALNTWWNGDPDQRYWMEIATEDVGHRLIAPKGEDIWSYDLVSQVQPADRVLHWKNQAILGWSEVTGPVAVEPEYTWQPRGTAGRALPGPRTTPGWTVPLGGLHPFTPPVTTATLQALKVNLMTLRADLEAQHGKPVYFPFYLYGGTQIRAQQGYLVKLPAELLDVVPGLDATRLGVEPKDPEGEELTEDTATPGQLAPKGRVTRTQDPKLRAAIERRSLDVAIDHYKALGATDDDIQELGKPFDLVVRLDGVERHVEVKGSSLLIDTVELTANEVTHGQSCLNSDLVVVSGIEWSRDDYGGVQAWGGVFQVWTDWTPSNEALSARTYAYELPPT